ncbi:hypothetical protein OF83DRAFT_676270 [Amylostereum chailletii]|nr:hypothetical protein OF83DRAFT_676270 [Amylostereum chailletii]
MIVGVPFSARSHVSGAKTIQYVRRLASPFDDSIGHNTSSGCLSACRRGAWSSSPFAICFVTREADKGRQRSGQGLIDAAIPPPSNRHRRRQLSATSVPPLFPGYPDSSGTDCLLSSARTSSTDDRMQYSKKRSIPTFPFPPGSSRSGRGYRAPSPYPAHSQRSICEGDEEPDEGSRFGPTTEPPKFVVVVEQSKETRSAALGTVISKPPRGCTSVHLPLSYLHFPRPSRA